MNYADNWSPGLDVKIMFKTVAAVRGGKRMLGYEELYIYGDKEKLDRFQKDIQRFVNDPWKLIVEKDVMLKDYLLFEYTGSMVDAAEVAINYGPDARTPDSIHINTIVPLKKSEFTIIEYNAVLDKFFKDIIKPYSKCHSNIVIEESDQYRNVYLN